jgi:hypothetical protein
MEFRFAAKALNLPVVIAIVGTGQQWRATEVRKFLISSLFYERITMAELQRSVPNFSIKDTL